MFFKYFRLRRPFLLFFNTSYIYNPKYYFNFFPTFENLLVEAMVFNFMMFQ